MERVAVIQASDVANAVCRLYRRISTELRQDVAQALRAALEQETSELARYVLAAIIENERISRAEGVPLCQDTGMAVAYVRMGASVVVEGGTLQEAVDEGVRRAVSEQFLRASTVADPIARCNVGDNTPAIVHLGQVEGEEITIDLMAKGGGAENTSTLRMLSPGDGIEGVKRAVVETVRQAGANACPPVIVGVGLGGDFETAPLLAKRALFRDLRKPNAEADLADLERELLEEINSLGIGPQGLGGRATALAVAIERAPCHIASLPVAVNIACHSHRHGRVSLAGQRRRLA
jgi:fumarate hydratase subunit alpha